MTHHFEITSRPLVGGNQVTGSLHGSKYALPAGSVLSSADAPLERGKVAQALIDILALTFGIFFICTTACSVPVALFLLLFARF